MVIGILQPGYLPWLGFFEQMYRSDIFVLYDDVQYDKNGWRNRNRIKTTNGALWLTIPVKFKLNQAELICEVKIDNSQKWRKKHFVAIQQSYSKAPFFQNYLGIFQEAYSRDWDLLIDIDIYFIEKLAAALGIGNTKLVRSSSLGIQGERTERLIKICKAFGADTFYEGISGKNYIDEAEFLREGIKVRFQEYHHPEYQQMHGGFISYLSVVDLLFNHGEESLAILLNHTPEKV
jgi:hypothetical protein